MSAAGRVGGQLMVCDRFERLERNLNATLLSATHEIFATEVGASFYSRCKHVPEAVDDARGFVADDDGQPMSSVLRVAAPHCSGEVELIPALQRLREQSPRLEMTLRFNDAVIDPIIEGVDLSSRVGSPSEGKCVGPAKNGCAGSRFWHTSCGASGRWSLRVVTSLEPAGRSARSRPGQPCSCL